VWTQAASSRDTEAQTMELIAFDSHKHYTLASVEDQDGGRRREARIPHEPGALREFLSTCDEGSVVAVEAIGNWYWIVDEIESAGCRPRLVHARKAKLMAGEVNKTDKLDARGLNRLQRNGTLPTVWIPPGELRDWRDLPRTRMVLVRQRTQLKNRIHATLAKYALRVEGVSDIFAPGAEPALVQAIAELPDHTAFATTCLLAQERSLGERIRLFERRIREHRDACPALGLLQTLPGVGAILATVIALEVGDVSRFARPQKLAAYGGVVPRIHSSGGRTHHGRARRDVNKYLKWPFVEAGNCCARHRKRYPSRHVSRLYTRLARVKGHSRAVVAVGRHLAEATYWILTKEEPYRDPASSTEA
jgi:transposase